MGQLALAPLRGGPVRKQEWGRGTDHWTEGPERLRLRLESGRSSLGSCTPAAPLSAGSARGPVPWDGVPAPEQVGLGGPLFSPSLRVRPSCGTGWGSGSALPGGTASAEAEWLPRGCRSHPGPSAALAWDQPEHPC